MAAKLTRLSHKIAIQLHLAADRRTICNSRSGRPVRKLLDTPSYVWESGGIFPRIISLGTRCRSVVTFTLQSSYSRYNIPWYPLNGKSQTRSEYFYFLGMCVTGSTETLFITDFQDITTCFLLNTGILNKKCCTIRALCICDWNYRL
jgi:hypothetical protein